MKTEFKNERAANIALSEHLRLEAEARFLNARENAALSARFAAIKPAPRRASRTLFQRLIGA